MRAEPWLNGLRVERAGSRWFCAYLFLLLLLPLLVLFWHEPLACLLAAPPLLYYVYACYRRDNDPRQPHWIYALEYRAGQWLLCCASGERSALLQRAQIWPGVISLYFASTESPRRFHLLLWADSLSDADWRRLRAALRLGDVFDALPQ